MSRKERLKVYHGLPKSVTDEHTIFYASFDGDIKAEIGDINDKYSELAISNSLMPTGYGIKRKTSIAGRSIVISDILKSVEIYTIDLCLTGGSGIRIGTGESSYGLQVRSDSISLYGASYTNDTKRVMTGFSNDNLVYIRLVYNSATKLLQCYANGKLFINEKVSGSCRIINAYNVYLLDELTVTYPKTSTLADLHISNIDRGDYFPNLPQDFIEGKAIIKPRMGQQQIKGDPMYSQETTDVVKIGTDVNEPQITCSRTTGSWASGDTIKVKGLNNEIVSGVIDTNTALARLTEPVTTSLKFKVDSVDKLSVGDKIRFISKVSSGWVDSSSWSERTISNIDAETKTVTVSSSELTFSAGQIALGAYAVETTTTTSSPIVKTSDGTVITGNWSNLGTNEATFTLGTNAILTNQDLYITYSLNIVSGNSDFTELPYSIEKVYDELGNELEEVSEIVIEDDFKGKVNGSTKECPHKILWNFSHDKNIDISTYNELGAISEYRNLSIADGEPKIFNTSSANWTPLVIAEFDILGCLKTKLNTEDLSLIDNIRIFVKANASNKNNSNLDVSLYNNSSSSWLTGWITNNAINYTEKSNIISNNVLNDYIKDGKVMIRFSTDVSDGITKSVINIDYVKIEIKLKTDSTFKIFYTNNKRAREMPCNPVLIQPQTKTVKRYLPSKECFSTELLNYSYETKHVENLLGEYLAVQTEKTVTSNGTGKYIPLEISGWKMLYANKIPLPKTSKWFDFSNDKLKIHADDLMGDSNHSLRLPIVRHWGAKRYCGVGTSNVGMDSCKTIPIQSDLEGINLFEFYGGLKLVNGELYLTVLSDKRIAKNASVPSNPNTWNYKLPNRPLMK